MPIQVRKRQVEPVPTTREQRPKQDFSGDRALAASISNFGQQLVQAGGIFEDIQDRNDTAAVKSAQNTIRKTLMERLVEARNIKGKQAVGVTESYTDYAKNQFESALSSLENPRQQRMFRMEMAPVMNNIEIDMYAHEQGEIRNWAKQETLAKRDNAIQSASINKYDPTQRSTDIQEAVNETREAYAELGEDVVKREVKNTLTAAHTAMIDSFLKDKERDNRVELASAYFDNHKEQINADVRNSLKDRINREKDTQRYQNKADDIYVKNDTYEGRLEAARKIDSAEERQAVLTLLDNMKVRDENAKKLRLNNALNTATNEMETAVQNDPNWRNAIFAIANKSDPEVRPTLLKTARSYIKGEGEIKTDPREYQRIKSLSHEEFVSENIAVNPLISLTDKKRLIDDQNKERETGKFTRSRTTTAKIKEAAEQVGINKPRNASESRQQEYNAQFADFANEVEQEINNLEESTGKKITPEEENKIINKKVIEKKLGKRGEIANAGIFNIGRGSNLSYEQAVEKGEANTWLPFVDDEELKQEITDKLIQDGNYKVNDTTIRLYARVYYMGLPPTSELYAEAQKFRNKAVAINE